MDIVEEGGALLLTGEENGDGVEASALEHVLCILTQSNTSSCAVLVSIWIDFATLDPLEIPSNIVKILT